MLQRFVSATRGVFATRALATVTVRPAMMSAIRVAAVRAFSVEAAAAAAEPVAAAPVADAATAATSRRPRTPRHARWTALLDSASNAPVDPLTWTTKEVGERGTLEWRLQFVRTGSKSKAAAASDPATADALVEYHDSPWHNIPLFVNPGQQFLRYVNEIPKGARPKMEIATKEENNPIKQDVKKGALRNFTYGDLPFNYGALPQTWENPHKAHPLTGKPGDNDPIDVVEVSDTPLEIGAVRVVRVLGAMALLDEGETDFKVLAIDMSHPLANAITDPESLEQHMPGKIAQIREWFKMYKTTDGKAENEFAFNGEVQSAALARGIIFDTHHEWAALLRGETANSGSLSLPSESRPRSKQNVLKMQAFLLDDVSFVVDPTYRELLVSVGQRQGKREPEMYAKLRDAYETLTKTAAQSPADAMQSEPTLRALRKALRVFVSKTINAGDPIPKEMPGAPVKKSIGGEQITTRTPKAVVTDRQSQLVNEMIDRRCRDFMRLFNLMSRQQTRTQVVYEQLAALYRYLVAKVEAEEKKMAKVTAEAAPAAATDAATPAAAAAPAKARGSHTNDLHVICGALRTYFLNRNVKTRESLPTTMPVISGNRAKLVPEPKAAAAPSVPAKDARATRRPARPARQPAKSTPAAVAAAGPNTTIAKSATRERKPMREGREKRKPREPRNETAATKTEKPAAAPAATQEESVGDLLAKVMQKLNSPN